MARPSAQKEWVSAVVERDAGATSHPGPGKRPLYPVSRVHLDALSTDLGIWQHARGAEPERQFGYCTDDVARAIIVDVLHSRELGWPAVDASVQRSLRFVQKAYDHTSGRFLNFRDADGVWLDVAASEDCHARALVGLAAVMGEVPGTDLADQARRLFLRALPASLSFGALRPVSATLLACDSVMKAGLSAEAGPAFDLLAARLVELVGEPTTEWPWSEPILTYENPLVPRALIAAGLRLGQPALIARGCSVLDWLIDVQTSESGKFSPIGNKTWWPRTAGRSQFDQQPIEAGSMIDAAADAYRATGRQRYLYAAENAYGWFLGDNDVGVPLAIPASGGCQDGLTQWGPNENQGGESTLMWLTALEQIRDLRRLTQSGPGQIGVAQPSFDGAAKGE
jgi:hypothetical protein